MNLHNLMEDEVLNAIVKISKDLDNICKCEICKMDIAAIALNRLKPNYVVTDQGYLYAKANNMNQQFNTDVIAAITNAIEIVGKNPRHEK